MPELIRCSCTRINDPWRRFCGGCGLALAPACSSCGFVNNKHDRFCGGCGTNVSRAGKPSLPARKDQTIPLDVIDEV